MSRAISKASTLSVGELIKLLEAYPEDAPVVIEWHGGWCIIEKESLAMQPSGQLRIDVSMWGSYDF